MAKDNVDKRVVEFELNNKKFNKDVDKSKKHVEELEDTLQFKDVSKSLDKVNKKLSALGVVAATTIANLANRVVDLGVKLVKSLSVDNLTAGWTKFGDKTKAVGTLMAQTLKVAGKEIENSAEQMRIVNEQMDKLNFFTDETSYNFIDMVDNIGKFTAAGIDLDVAVNAMEGIANWAAVSGQNAATASRAMYQLSQALGKGYVQLIDYKSIQNANMDTQEFRQTVLDTAVAMGELTKEGQNYITKAGTKFTRNQFTEQLSSKWFTSGVLTKTLERYSSAVDKLFQITEEKGITAAEAMELYADEFDEFGLKAMKAAQECRTLSDALNAIKDAVSTNWMTTFEQIFGGYNDAKTFWSDISNSLYEAFVTGGQFRNEMLKTWNALEGRATLFAHTGDDDQGAFWNIVDAIDTLKSSIKDAWNTVFPKSDLEDASEQAKEAGANLKRITTNIRDATKRFKEFWQTNDNLKKALTGIFTLARALLEIVFKFANALSPLLYVAKELLGLAFDFIGRIGDALSSSTSVLRVIDNVCNGIYSTLTSIFSVLNVHVLETIRDILVNVGQTLKNIIAPALEKVGNFFTRFVDSVKKGISTIKTKLESISFKRKKEDNVVTQAVETTAESMGATEESKEKISIFTNIVAALKDLLEALTALIKSVYSIVISLVNVATGLLNFVSKAINLVVTKLEDINSDAEKVKQALKNMLAIFLIVFVLIKGLVTIFNIIWNLEYIRATVFSAVQELGYTFAKFAKSKILQGVADIIKGIGLSMIEIAMAFHIFSYVDKKGIILGGIILASLLGLVIATFVIIRKKNSSLLTTISKVQKEWKITGQRADTTLYQIAAVMRNIGFAMIEIALAFKMFGDINENSIKSAERIFAAFLVAIILMVGASMSIGDVAQVASIKAPRMMTAIGIVLMMRALAKSFQILLDPEVIESIRNAPWIAIGIYVAFAAIVVVMLLIVRSIKKVEKVAEAGSGNKLLSFTLFKRNPIAQILTSVALLLASIAGSLYVIELTKSLDPEGFKNTAIILGIIVGSILVFASVMALLTKQKKLGKSSQNNPIAALMASLSAVLLSIAATIAILHAIDPDRMWEFLGMIGALLVALTVVIWALVKISGKMNAKQGKGIQRLVILMGSMALLFTILGSIISLFAHPWETLALIGALMFGTLGAIELLVLISKQMDSVKITGLLKMSLVAVAIGAMAGALYLMSTYVKPDWEVLKYVGAVIGVMIALAALFAIPGVGAFLDIGFGWLALGIAAISASLALLGVSLIPLANGITTLVPAMNQIEDDKIPLLRRLLLVLSATGVTGILGIVGNSSLAVGMETLGWGLKSLIPEMNQIDDSKIPLLRRLLLVLSGTGVTGILGILGNSSLAVGMETLGWGLSNLIEPMSKLEDDKVESLKKLLNVLSSTGIRGIAAIFGNSSLAAGMANLGKGLNSLFEAITPEKADLLKYISDVLSAMKDKSYTDFVIKPVVDLSNVRAGIASIRSEFANIASPGISGAYSASSAINGHRDLSGGINNNYSYADTYAATFNISEVSDAREVAEEVDRILQQKYKASKLAH